MIAEGLLWFDDDPRRPLQEKIANAIERYSERTGWLPTVCETHPAQAESFLATLARNASATATPAATRRRGTSATTATLPPAPSTASSKRQAKANAAPLVALPPKLRVIPNASLRPNYFLIGVEPGEKLRKAPSQPVGAARRKARRSPAAASEPAAPVPSSQPPKAPKAPRAKAS